MNPLQKLRNGGLSVVLGLLLCTSAQAQETMRRADAAETQLPKDIDPITRYRLPMPTRADMTTDEERRIFDEMTKDGLPPLRLFSPKLAKPLGDAHHYLKFDTGMDGRLIEIAVLVTSRELNDQFEWTQWEGHGRVPGHPSAVEPAVIDIIKYCKPVVGLGPKETLIINFGRELLGPQKKVSSETFAEALRLFGRRGTVDLVDLIALYVATATELDAYDAHLAVGQKPLLPPLESTPDCRRQ
jgi:4-carboxymuconolactone decarboxylase